MSKDSVHKTTGAYLAFVSDVPESARKKIMRGCPSSINGYLAWGDRLLSVETAGDALEWELREAYGTKKDKAKPFPEPTVSMLKAFAKEANDWIVKVHSLYPLLFAIGPGEPKEKDVWEEESQGRVTVLLVDFLTEYAARNEEELSKEDDHVTDKITKDHLACMLQYLPQDLPKTLQSKASALQKKFKLQTSRGVE
jgi:hypothetical protein